MVACRSILSVNYVWGRNKYHKLLGELCTIPAKMDRKCALKVQIERSAAFLLIGGSLRLDMYPNLAKYIKKTRDAPFVFS